LKVSWIPLGFTIFSRSEIICLAFGWLMDDITFTDIDVEKRRLQRRK
jgi:hypothetical protein